MLALTRKTGYALVAMARLAELPAGSVISAREIAQFCGVPVSLLMNVMKELAAAEYVESLRGSRGGYRLARQPEEIILADVVAVIEGPVRQAQCLLENGQDRPCSMTEMLACSAADPVHKVQRKLRDFLKTVTLAEIANPVLQVDR